MPRRTSSGCSARTAAAVPRDAEQRLAFLRARAAELRAARQEIADKDRRVAEVIEHGSTNLVTPELVHECRRFLDAELAEYQHRAHAASRAIDEHHRILGRGIVLGNIVGSMLGGAVFSGLIALIWYAAR